MRCSLEVLRLWLTFLVHDGACSFHRVSWLRNRASRGPGLPARGQSHPGLWAAVPTTTVHHPKFYEPTSAHANNSEYLKSTTIAKFRPITTIA